MSKPSARAIAYRGWLTLCVGLAACSQDAAEMEQQQPPVVVTEPARYVNPFIGSGGFGYRHGSAFPGAAAPHGLTKVGPDTKGPWGTIGFLHFSGYWYGDDVVQGFSHMHLHGTGATDYGVLSVMPMDQFSAQKITQDKYGSAMDKASEEASPGYYAVTLRNGGVRTELTATPHAAHHRYAFDPSVSSRVLLFDLDHHLESGSIPSAEFAIDAAKQTIKGHLRSLGGMTRGFGGYELYFVARTKTAWKKQMVWKAGSAPAEGTASSGKGVGFALIFDEGGDPAGSGADRTPIELQVGLSLVSEEQAAKNLAAELPGWDFAATRKQTAAAWDERLTRVRVTGGTEPERRMFYSSLYRCFLMPSIHSDVDGSFLGFDGKVAKAEGYHYVSDLSLWDTYRTLHPLYSLLAPESALDSVRSLLTMAQHSGQFPKWPLAGGDSGSMIGAPAELVIADAYLKGIRGFDAEAAYQILRAAAADPVAPKPGRGGRNHVEEYLRLGYVPTTEASGAASWTTEYARGDFALGQLAAALGHDADAKQLQTSSRNHLNLFDAKTRYLRGRSADGSFPAQTFDPRKFTDDYIEANAYQSMWMNDHDVKGLADKLGGNDALIQHLQQVFQLSQTEWDAADQTAPTAGVDRPEFYWHGNEPDISAPYLFALAGRPHLTQEWARWVQETQYRAEPAGLPGNDDGGTMSAWYLFTAMGFYPLVGTDRYIIGAPLFPRIELSVPGGVFVIEAPNVSKQNRYVSAVTLDGKPITNSELFHKDIKAASTLRFTMSATAK
jgi:predicted alpha-1,2-mannosidase